MECPTAASGHLPTAVGRQGGRRNAAPTRAYTKSRSSLIPYRWAADLPALLSDAANERFILRKDCEAVGSFVPEICRQKSAFPGSLPEAVSAKEPRNFLFGGLHAKPVTSLLRTLRAYARSQGFWLQAAP